MRAVTRLRNCAPTRVPEVPLAEYLGPVQASLLQILLTISNLGKHDMNHL